MNFLKRFIDFCAPEHCIVTGEYISGVEHRIPLVSDRFLDSMPYAPSPQLIKNRLVNNFKNDELYLSKVDSLLQLSATNNVIKIIHHIKYGSKIRLGYEFGRLLGNRLKNDDMTYYDIIVPVPVHSIRKRERGYNQAEIIAKGVSAEMNIPLKPDLIKRKKFSHSQTKLNTRERFDNVKNTFQINSEQIIKNKNILLIDDVLTTGSTLNSTALELIKNDVRLVDAATLVIV